MEELKEEIMSESGNSTPNTPLRFISVVLGWGEVTGVYRFKFQYQAKTFV